MKKHTNALLEAALAYSARKWSIIPIRNRLGTSGKQPAVRTWAEYQRTRPADAELRKWFHGNNKNDGLAVVMGAVSGGLTCRDFDAADAYHKWAAYFPGLAKTLPTVRTARGFHVYFRSSAREIKTLGDGELRGRGYTVLPPSRHPSGIVYQWLIPLPEGDLPEIDPRKHGLAGFTERTEKTERTESTETQRKMASVISVLSVSEPAIQAAIQETLPAEVGRRNRAIFELCRRLKAIRAVAGEPAATLRNVVQEWHRLALPAISTKPFDETWADFVYGWQRVRLPAGQGAFDHLVKRARQAPLPAAAGRYECNSTRLLVAVCAALQNLAGDQPFFLSCRTAAAIMGRDHVSANKLLNMLIADGVLRVARRHTERLATRYFFTDENS